MFASSESRSVDGLCLRSARPPLLIHGGGRCGNRGAISKDLWARPRVHGSGRVHGPSLGLGFLLSSGWAFERDRIRVVDDAIEDGVGDRRLAQIRVPLIAGQLARDDRRASRVAILQHFEKILTLDVGLGGQAPVIEDQDIDPCESREQNRVGAVGARERQLLKEPW